MKMWKIHRLILVLLVSMMYVSGCRAEKKQKRGKMVRVTLSELQKRKFQQRIPIKGTVAAVDGVKISAKTEGVLEELPVSEGDYVKKGSLMFSIDRVTLENDVMLKKQEVEVAKTELSTAEIDLKLALTREEKARQDYDRAETLNKKSVISKTDHETAVVNWKAAVSVVDKCKVTVEYRKAKLAEARINLRISEKKLKDAMVTAPYDCVITDLPRDQWEYVKTGDAILSLQDVSRLQVTAYLSAVYHPLVVTNKTPVVVSVDGKVYGKCVVTYRAETIDPQSRTFKIKVRLPKNLGLVSGMLCDLDIILREQNGYGMPEASILQLGQKFYVYTATAENTAKSVEVKKGIVDGNYCQILNPEKLRSKKILITGQRFVNDGDKIFIGQ